MTDPASYIHLIRQLDALVATFEEHPDAATREQALALLSGLDALHRTGLERLVERLREAGGGMALEQATTDPVVRTLLSLYDLAPLDVPMEPAPPAGLIPLDQVGILDNSFQP